ncbi:alkaline phosphatase PhoX [Hydrogenovibrio marinus]|uniref:Alkaline phosphatase n=1 Tax=Hydrogenovibrio marinus TaxID=28885 RepID=A0A066ZP99_HYDMR|nr:alkaline phosphatase PhoX [Hydrogenovibrio marinus]KDN95628.1 hypothetical protein EI16_04830 [Hydrogenovibrio marinus]BBN60125.1 hypothetical protein HVMH_1719 [Hydrogenovibrio marinus]
MKTSLLYRSILSVIVVGGLGALSACSQQPTKPSSQKPARLSVDFQPIAPAVTQQEKDEIRSVKKVTINGQEQAIDYHRLMQTGQQDNGETFGVVKDYQDKVIREADGSAYLCNGTDTGEGSGLDHVSILQKNENLYMVSQFECGPGAMYVNQLEQSKDGHLSLKPNSLQFISQKEDFGGWVHCAGVTTPWQSHLGSEEYEPDANPKAPKPYQSNRYYQSVGEFYWHGDILKNNPYFYGWTPEVSIDDKGQPQYTKHYSMGRFAHELAYVMPDNRTVYLSDDGANVGFFMFVADKTQDLSAGTLYAAKWHQTWSKGLGAAQIEWISLGHADNKTVKDFVATKPHFDDIFETAKPKGDSCPTGFQSVNASAGHECLKLMDVNKDGKVDAADEMIASRLETRRMAAYKGATVEFNKEEGITFNPDDNKLYVAMSQVREGMENFAKKGKSKDTYDIGGPNDIQLAYNFCGGVYQSDVAKDEKIGSDYVVKNMVGLLEGTPKSYKGTEYEGNKCDINGVANPDNLTYLPGAHLLVVGEDTSKHPNDMVWAYHTKSDEMQRIFTVPFGAETTSPYWYKDINGFGYLTMTTQHPFGEVKKDYVRPAGVDTKTEAGYIGPFKFSTQPK